MITFVRIKEVIESGMGKLFSGVGALGSEHTDRGYFQQTGFTSIPKDDAVGIVIHQGNNYTAVGSIDKQEDRPQLTTKGDVAIYTSSDMLIKISASGVIEIMGNGTSGSIKVGTGTLKNLVTDTVFTAMNAHTHTGGTLGGGLTGPPTYAPLLSSPTHVTSELEAS